jgi:predicted nucleotidyltransferase component of viral defense system
MSKSNVASILARLRNRARSTGYPVETMLLLHLCERFLARVAVSQWRDALILKGGLNLYSRYRETARPTRDIDLAVLRFDATEEAVTQVLQEIMVLDLSDEVCFLPDTLKTQSILEDAGYSGIRAYFMGALSQSETKAKLQLDFSFGNAITPAPVLLSFPNALGLADTKILGYPLESVIAEKIAALIELGSTTTRLKDFYDLFQIITREPPTPKELVAALQKTFQRRGTNLENCAEKLRNLCQEPRLQTDWHRFLQDNSLTAPKSLEITMQPVILAVENALIP